jgi:phosphoserine aminotransferase
VVIVRDDLLERASAQTPSVWHYRAQSQADSMLNTPATYSWYIAGLVFQWLKREGGLEVMAERNARKAAKLYAAIDQSDFYRNPVEPGSRSWMNVPFVLADDQLDGAFLKGASEAGLETLKGHRSVGGMRASIYNAMPESGVDALIEFMADFEKRNG